MKKRGRKVKMQKQAQLALFVIIALIVIVAGISFSFYYRRLTLHYAETVRNIVDSQKQCAAVVLDKAIIEIAKRSGYFVVPQNVSVSYANHTVALYYVNSTAVIPELQAVDNAILQYFNSNQNCSNSISGFKVSLKCYKVETMQQVTMMQCRLHLSKQLYRARKLIQVYSDLSLYNLINASHAIINNYAENPGYICIECLDEIATTYAVNVSILPITQEVNATINTAWFFVKPLNASVPVLRFAVEL